MNAAEQTVLGTNTGPAAAGNGATATTTTEAPHRAMMNGKPVHTVPARTVLNLDSGFREKLLCDGPTFSLGDACAYDCTFCYVPAQFRKLHRVADIVQSTGRAHHELVIRRAHAVEILARQLERADGRPRFPDPADRRVVYTSPSVDCAANMDLVRETVEACRVILAKTHWQIRLLSKSNLLPSVAAGLEEHRDRLIFGVSTGTLDDSLARVFEAGTPLVSKRLASLHLLQDRGFRTFGMICPSLPQWDYPAFARGMFDAIRADRCEHVWAEVINLRGESFLRTYHALQPTHPREAELLRQVMNDADKWEAYARATFEAHAPLYAPANPPEDGVRGTHTGPAAAGNRAPGYSKLRFLQYVNAHTVNWWHARAHQGAVVL